MIRSILKESSLFLISTIISKASMFFITIMISRLLGKEIFGQMSLIRGFISTLEIYIAMGINHTTTKAIAEVKDSNYNSVINNSFFIILFNLLIVATVMLFFIDDIAISIFKTDDADFIFALKSSLVLLFFASFVNLLNSIFTGLESYLILAKSSLYSSLLSLPIAIYLIKTFQLIGSVYAVSSFFIIHSFLMIYYIRKIIINFVLEFSFKKISFEERWKMIRFSFPLFFSIILTGGLPWYSKTLLISSSGDSFGEVALFESSFQWLMIIIIITSSISNISLSKFSKLFSDNNNQDLKKMLKLNIMINFTISILSILIISFYSEYIMELYGEGYRENSNNLIFLLFASIPLTANGVLIRFFVSVNKNWYNLYGSLLWAIVFIGGLLYYEHLDANSLVLIFDLSYSVMFLFSLVMSFYFFKGESL